MKTVRYNCHENDNFIKYNMYLVKKGLYLPDEIEMGNMIDDSTTVFGFYDLCDSLIIAVGYEILLEQLKERQARIG